MGRIIAPFGVRGWVKVRPFTQRTDGLLDYREWWIGADSRWRSLIVTESAIQGNLIAAHFTGIDDRDAAGALCGKEIGISRSAMPPAAADEFYWSDLLGLDVKNLEGERLGTVDAFLETGAHGVMVLRDSDRERLLPFVGAIVKQVDLEGRNIVVDWESDF